MGALPARRRRRRARGRTSAEAFEQAALALTAIATDAEVMPQAVVEVQCEAPDIELLFVEWLNAIIYEMAIRSMLFGRFAVRIEGSRLTGTLWSEPVDVGVTPRPASLRVPPIRRCTSPRGRTAHGRPPVLLMYERVSSWIPRASLR
jgi:SHS2 domain-containing protein